MTMQKTFDFMRFRRIAAIISIVLVLGSIVSLVTKGLHFGLDFTGGVLVELHYEEAPELEEVRQVLAQAGYPNAVVVYFGSDTEVMVRVQSEDAGLGDTITAVLREHSSSAVDMVRSEFVGPQIGEELRDDGGLGMLLALVVVMAYVAVRFQFKFSVAAVVALIHDVIIVLGLFSLLQLDFDLTVLAAILAVIGYSLNDTIVVADRIRENFRIVREGTSMDIINESLNQTLGRTLMTSLTTIIVLLALFFVGGELIHNFATALLVGVGVGTYSSIYVAANILVVLNIRKEDLMPPPIEGEEVDEMP